MTSSWSFGECEGLLIWRDVILYTREFIHHGGLGDRPAGFQCVQIQPGNKSGGVHFALRPQKRDGLFGGRGGGGDERVKARPRIPPEKDRRDRGLPPEQWKC